MFLWIIITDDQEDLLMYSSKTLEMQKTHFTILTELGFLVVSWKLNLQEVIGNHQVKWGEEKEASEDMTMTEVMIGIEEEEGATDLGAEVQSTGPIPEARSGKVDKDLIQEAHHQDVRQGPEADPLPPKEMPEDTVALGVLLMDVKATFKTATVRMVKEVAQGQAVLAVVDLTEMMIEIDTQEPKISCLLEHAQFWT